MSLHIDYLSEKISAAVSGLASGSGSVQSRLLNAFGGPLHNLAGSDWSKIDPEIASEIRKALEAIEAYYSAEPSATWGSLEKMDDETAAKVAERLVSALEKICRVEGLNQDS